MSSLYLCVTPALGHRPAGHFRRGRGTRDSWHCQRDRRRRGQEGEEEGSVTTTGQCLVLTSICISGRQMEAVCPLETVSVSVVKWSGSDLGPISWELLENTELQSANKEAGNKHSSLWCNGWPLHGSLIQLRFNTIQVYTATLCAVAVCAVGARLIVCGPLEDSGRSIGPSLFWNQ